MWSRASLVLPALVSALAACSSSMVPGAPAGDGGALADATPSPDAAADAISDAPDGAAGETCPATFAPCTPAAGTTHFVRLKGTVVTPDRVVCDGEVLFSPVTGQIVCAGADCGAAPEAQGAQVACANGVIYPGIIDPHQHADYNHLPVFRHTQRYDNRNTWRHHEPLYTTFKIPHRPFGSTARVNQRLVERWAEARIVMSGGTAMAGTAGVLRSDGAIAGLVRNVDSRIAAASGLTDGAYVDPDTDAVVVHTGDGAADDALTATHLASIARRLADPNLRAYLPHLAEGIDGNARAEFDAAARYGVITAKTGIVHCVGCSTPQLARMAAVHADLIWSPRSNLDLYGQTAAVTTAHALGVTIALGVDWTPSGSVNPIGELQCAAHLNDRYLDHAFTDRELVAMVTSNAAAALNLGDRLGRIAPNYLADLTVVAGDRTRPYRALLGARAEQIRLVIINGQAVYGDPDVLTGELTAAMGCMPVPDGVSPDGSTGVCGHPKLLCVPPDGLAALRTAMTAGLDTARAADAACAGATPSGDYCYGYQLFTLFRCGAGPELDRCEMGHSATPRRAAGGGTIAAVPGVPMPGIDSDGDGVPDAMDDCPRVFNPPFDTATTQDDANGNGVGDACDPHPCARADGSDACPFTAPITPPGPPASVAVTIPQLRDPSAMGHPAAMSLVTVQGAVVTAVTPAGSFFAQDPGAAAFAGVYVYLGTASAMVHRGDVVTVTGAYLSFRGLDQIDARAAAHGTVMVTDTGAVPAPLDVTPAEIATGGAHAAADQSMLVRVADVTAMAATDPAGNFPLTQGALIVTSFVAAGAMPSPFPATAGQAFRSITGVVYSYGPPAGPFQSELAPPGPMDLTAM